MVKGFYSEKLAHSRCGSPIYVQVVLWQYGSTNCQHYFVVNDPNIEVVFLPARTREQG